GECPSYFPRLQLCLEQTGFFQWDHVGVKAAPVITDGDIERIVGAEGANGGKAGSSMIIDVEECLGDGVRDGFSDFFALHCLFQVGMERIECPEICLYFQLRLGMERGQILAN